MTGARALLFFDTNVLIQLHVATAPRHTEITQAARLLLAQDYKVWISRQVLREYASVLTRSQPYTLPPAPADVAAQLRLFEANYRIADETAPVTAALCALLETVPFGGKQVHDANIAATMQAYGITHLFTLNPADFARFAHLITVITPADVVDSGLE